MPSITEMEREIRRLSARIAILERGTNQRTHLKLSSSEIQYLLKNDDLWPICQNKTCRKKIHYDDKKHGCAGKWLSRKYCCRRCVTVATNMRLNAENPAKICVECGNRFTRSFSEKVRKYKEREICYRCDGQHTDPFGFIKPGFSLF